MMLVELTSRFAAFAPAWLLASASQPVASQPVAPQHWHHFIDVWFMAIPMPVAKLAPVALLVLAGLGSLMIKRSYVYLGAPDQARWRDLRLWAVLCLIPYVAIYLWFG